MGGLLIRCCHYYIYIHMIYIYIIIYIYYTYLHQLPRHDSVDGVNGVTGSVGRAAARSSTRTARTKLVFIGPGEVGHGGPSTLSTGWMGDLALERPPSYDSYDHWEGNIYIYFGDYCNPPISCLTTWTGSRGISFMVQNTCLCTPEDCVAQKPAKANERP